MHPPDMAVGGMRHVGVGKGAFGAERRLRGAVDVEFLLHVDSSVQAMTSPVSWKPIR